MWDCILRILFIVKQDMNWSATFVMNSLLDYSLSFF